VKRAPQRAQGFGLLIEFDMAYFDRKFEYPGDCVEAVAPRLCPHAAVGIFPPGAKIRRLDGIHAQISEPRDYRAICREGLFVVRVRSIGMILLRCRECIGNEIREARGLGLGFRLGGGFSFGDCVVERGTATLDSFFFYARP